MIFRNTTSQWSKCLGISATRTPNRRRSRRLLDPQVAVEHLEQRLNLSSVGFVSDDVEFTVEEFDDGTQQYLFANGTELLVFDDGTEWYLYTDGTELMLWDDGTELYIDYDGTETYLFSDGSELIYYPDGSEVFVDLDGTESYLFSDGTEFVYFADGSELFIDWDGTELYSFADGTELVVLPDGSEIFTDVDGTETFFAAHEFENESDEFEFVDFDEFDFFDDVGFESVGDESGTLATTFGQLDAEDLRRDESGSIDALFIGSRALDRDSIHDNGDESKGDKLHLEHTDDVARPHQFAAGGIRFLDDESSDSNELFFLANGDLNSRSRFPQTGHESTSRAFEALEDSGESNKAETTDQGDESGVVDRYFSGLEMRGHSNIDQHLEVRYGASSDSLRFNWNVDLEQQCDRQLSPNEDDGGSSLAQTASFVGIGLLSGSAVFSALPKRQLVSFGLGLVRRLFIRN